MQSYLAQGDVSRLSAVLKENYQALTEAYLDTRQAIDNLRLTPQDGLETWLDRITGEFENATSIPVERDLHGLDLSRLPMLTPEVQAQLIRIIQEAFSNIRKHARAQHVRLNIREWQGELVIEVGDDGLGFDAGDVLEVSQHGLRGMRERAELIGAEFQIISQLRQGTTVRLVLPPSLEEEAQR
jgi:two-component system, NarL family, nitrate/nitrite sensor histidine kinase NarX